MLVELRIRNVAVIDAVTLSLGPGLNVLTGETGAGKSLIIGALGMLLGERAAADRVRPGAERATVEGVFELKGRTDVAALLDERGVEVDDDLLVLKREVLASGRSRAWINGAPVSAGVLAEVGGRLVSVHGQHESRQLLDPDHQRDVFDAFAHATAAREQVAAAHALVTELDARAHALDVQQAAAAKRADYLRYVVAEIESVQPKAGEDEALDGDIRRLAHAEELQGLARQAAAVLATDERAILPRLSSLRRALVALARIDPDTERLQSGFDGAVYALEALHEELDRYAEGIEADPERLRTLERRRDALHGVMRKHGPTLDEVQQTLAAAQTELALVDGAAPERARLAAERAAAQTARSAAVASLTAAREAAAKPFGAAVSALLPRLGMPAGEVAVLLSPRNAVTADGAEQIALQARLNAGADWRPLGRLASGGELSRVMLALSTVLAQLQRVPTLVFDEVDAGVGGAVATQVAALMRRVASHHQVLAISHLAQIAAQAHHHVVVRKSAVGTVTTADTLVVEGEDRVVEIARMLGGDADREVSRAHARELLDRGRDAAPLSLDSIPLSDPVDDRTSSSRPRVGQRRGKPR